MQTTDPPARMLAEGDPLGAPLRRALDQAMGLLRDRLDDSLHAVVLTGSLARGEGATVDTGQGPRMLSDLDLYVLVADPDRVDAAALRSDLARSLADAVGPVVVDLGVVAPDHFARLGTKLPARQMSFGAQALLETGRPWERPAEVAPDSRIPVDRDDALRLLQNRMGEGLLRRSGPLDDLRRFHAWKITWDAPLAFLAAAGGYHPDRTTQWARLRTLADAYDVTRAWWAEGHRRLEAMWAARAAGPISRSTLEELAGDLQAWVWPFLRATIVLATDPGADAARALDRAVDAGPPRGDDTADQLRWLRRRGLARTLREARRWAGEGPDTVTPWWRHGAGGTGPDRILAAASLRWGGAEGWARPLAGLHVPPPGDANPDRWLGETWSDWITGGARR